MLASPVGPEWTLGLLLGSFCTAPFAAKRKENQRATYDTPTLAHAWTGRWRMLTHTYHSTLCALVHAQPGSVRTLLTTGLEPGRRRTAHHQVPREWLAWANAFRNAALCLCCGVRPAAYAAACSACSAPTLPPPLPHPSPETCCHMSQAQAQARAQEQAQAHRHAPPHAHAGQFAAHFVEHPFG